MKSLLALLCVGLLLPMIAKAEGSPSTDADREAVVKGNNAFAIELYSQLKNQPGNLFFSPESISTALTIAYAGARGETATEMANVLHLSLSPEKLHPTVAALVRDRNKTHDGYTLKEADGLWGQQGFDFLPDFLKLTKENYSAGFNSVDFKDASDAVRQAINQWVEQRTEGKIKNLLQPGVITPSARLVLTNAIYFKGDWQTQFKKEDTKEEDFHVSATQTVKTPLMHLTASFNYFDGGVFQILEIPYKKNELSMIVFLPNEVDGLPAFEQSLEKIQMWIALLSSAPKVIVSIPKFKIEKQSGVANTLAAIGMKQAFDEKKADFSGMIGKKQLYISAVIHKAYVDVNEEGSEASSVTGIVVPLATVPSREPVIPVFRADHPFLFLIRDNKSGGIFFMGRVTNPIE